MLVNIWGASSNIIILKLLKLTKNEWDMSTLLLVMLCQEHLLVYRSEIILIRKLYEISHNLVAPHVPQSRYNCKIIHGSLGASNVEPFESWPFVAEQIADPLQTTVTYFHSMSLSEFHAHC